VARAPWRRGICADAASAASFRAVRWAGAPAMLGAVSLSLENQVNFLPVLAELQSPTRGRVRMLIAATVLISLLYYTATSLLVYATFCDAVKQDALRSYDGGVLAVATRAAFAAQTAASFPLTSVVLRDVLDTMLPPTGERSAREGGVRIKLLSAGIVLLSAAVAALRPPLETVMALTGALGGSTLAFVFPGALLFEARRRRCTPDARGSDLSVSLLLGAAEPAEAADGDAHVSGAFLPAMMAAAGLALAAWSSSAVLLDS
jgi:amino acid permease